MHAVKNATDSSFIIFRPSLMLLDHSSPIPCRHSTEGIHAEGTICLISRTPSLSCCNQHHLEKVYLITEEARKNYLLTDVHATNKPACPLPHAKNCCIHKPAQKIREPALVSLYNKHTIPNNGNSMYYCLLISAA